jgi:hypothetical protein
VTTSAENVRFTPVAATNGFDPGGTIRRSVNVRSWQIVLQKSQNAVRLNFR